MAASDAATIHGKTSGLAGLPAAASWRILARGSCSPRLVVGSRLPCPGSGWHAGAVGPRQRCGQPPSLQRGGGSKTWHSSCLHPYGLLRRTFTVETQVSRLPWYPPDLQHHKLAHSSSTDAPKAKGLPVLSPNLCTACSMLSTQALLLTYPLAFPAGQLRRTPWHCWPRQLASPGAQRYNRQWLQVLGHSKYALENQPGIGEASFTSNTSSFRSGEGRNPSPRSATVTPLNI